MTTIKRTARKNVVSFRVSDEDMRALAEICRLRESSFSDLLREALANLIPMPEYLEGDHTGRSYSDGKF